MPWFAGTWLLSFVLVMTVSHSWSGLITTIVSQNAGKLAASPLLGEIWDYAALIMGLALIGALITTQARVRNNVALLGGACFGFFILAQFHYQTPSTIDRNLAYGIWFVCLVAGYACSKLIMFPGARRQLAVLCCAAAFVYPAVASWQAAWQRYHSWPDANAFLTAFRPVAGTSDGSLSLPGLEASIAEYYTRQGYDWTRWNGSLPLNPSPAVGSLNE